MLVSEVTTGGAAEKAGIKAGDVIVQVEGKPINGMEELRSALNDNFTGDTRKVSLTIVRDRHEQTVSAELTRSQMWEKRTSNAAADSSAEALDQLKRAQDDGQLRQEVLARKLADAQRAMVQAEVLKEKQKEKAEWQRQLQQQMRSLKDQIQQMQNVHVVCAKRERYNPPPRGPDPRKFNPACYLLGSRSAIWICRPFFGADLLGSSTTVAENLLECGSTSYRLSDFGPANFAV